VIELPKTFICMANIFSSANHCYKLSSSFAIIFALLMLYLGDAIMLH